ncbi:MAG: alpha/beta hydrolase fold domain-containing protein [Phycisphaerales bacterium JB061]
MIPRCHLRIGAAMACTLLIASASAQPVPTHDDVVYANVGGQDLALDLYLPDTDPGPYPVVIWIHGGGWAGGSNDSPAFVRPLGAMGVAVASVQYRLTSQEGQFGDEPVIWPAQIHDVKAAVRFLRANAAMYNLDPDKFASWGTSAGGHLSAVLGLSAGDAFLEGDVGDHVGTSSSIRVAVDYFGPTDLMRMDLDVTDPPGSTIEHDAPTSPESNLVGWDQPGQGIGDIRANIGNPNPPYDALVPLVLSASPYVMVSQGDAPIFIGHGAQDTSVPMGQSERLAERCLERAVVHEFVISPDAGHGSLGQGVDYAALRFLTTHLGIGDRFCEADVNNDGRLTPADLSTWIAAFNGESPSCDQNDDGACSPADFSAWVGKYNAGCS